MTSSATMSDTAVKVSIVLPVYNGADTILETIRSVIKQSFTAFELLIIDDGSTDETLNLVKSIHDERLKIHTFKNAGLSASRNRGIRLAIGEYIAFLDDDDLWLPGKLAAQVEMLERNPAAALCYTWVNYIDRDGKFLYPSNRISANGDLHPALLASNFLVTGSNPMVRKSAFDAVGLFDEALRSAEDWDMWLRLAARFDLVCAPTVQVLYRRYVDSMSFNLQTMETASLTVQKRAFENIPPHLKRWERVSYANTYLFLTSQALKANGSFRDGLQALKFYFKAIQFHTRLLRPMPLFPMLVIIFSMLLLPGRVFRLLTRKLPRIFRADFLYRYWQGPDVRPQTPVTASVSGENRCPLKVAEVDFLKDSPTPSNCEDPAFVMLRFGGKAVGQAVVPAEAGVQTTDKLIESMSVLAKEELWRAVAEHFLKLDRPPPKSSQLTATIAICTHDRPNELQRCLERVTQLEDRGQQIIVIDNCPSDDGARTVAEKFERVRYILEETRGLNHARNRAIAEAKTDIVAFIDDDAVPDQGWLDALKRNFEDPLVVCTTGLVMPLELETQTQQLFEQHSSLARGFKKERYSRINVSPAAVSKIGVGTNMAFHRERFQNTMGQFDTRFGVGSKLSCAGDLEIFARIIALGYRIIYDPDALVWHKHRSDPPALRKILFNYGKGTYGLWTSLLLNYQDLAVIQHAGGWFVHQQLPALIHSLRGRPGSLPLAAILAQLWGCMLGPFVYIASSITHRRGGR